MRAGPLSMALVASAANGTWRPSRLVAARLIAKHGDHVQPPHAIAHAATLRSMMRAVVTDGTAAHAEYGSADGGAHGWFIGFAGDLAFAALVADGGGGWWRPRRRWRPAPCAAATDRPRPSAVVRRPPWR
jgi:cell division protein FtsI/penicillin-binding protein 2